MGIGSIFRLHSALSVLLGPTLSICPPHLPLPASHPNRYLRGALLRMTTLDRLIAAAGLLAGESTATPD